MGSGDVCAAERLRQRSEHVQSRGQAAAGAVGLQRLLRVSSDGKNRGFSKDRGCVQVEYAIEAIKLGSTVIGICTNEGVVLAVEKRVTSPLMEPRSIEKVMEVDSHMGIAMSGLTSDARFLIDHARSESQNHSFTFDEQIPVESLTQSISDLALQFGEGDEATLGRPFGVALLLAGNDDRGTHLFHTDPAGTFTRCSASAIGSGSEGAQSSLQEHYSPDMSLQAAEDLALSTLKAVMEDKVSKTNVDIAEVAPHYHLFSEDEVQAVINRVAQQGSNDLASGSVVVEQS